MSIISYLLKTTRGTRIGCPSCLVPKVYYPPYEGQMKLGHIQLFNATPWLMFRISFIIFECRSIETVFDRKNDATVYIPTFQYR